jgi:hypothetical protein
VASRVVYLEVNIEKIKYMVVSRHQNGGQSHYLLMASKTFGSVRKFKYWGTAATNENYIHEESRSRLNSRNAYFRSV